MPASSSLLLAAASVNKQESSTAPVPPPPALPLSPQGEKDGPTRRSLSSKFVRRVDPREELLNSIRDFANGGTLKKVYKLHFVILFFLLTKTFFPYRLAPDQNKRRKMQEVNIKSQKVLSVSNISIVFYAFFCCHKSAVLKVSKALFYHSKLYFFLFYHIFSYILKLQKV